MSAWSEALDGYLGLRRALGFRLHEHERLLRGLVGELDAVEADHLSVQAALSWAGRPTRDSERARRLSIVRAFATYLNILDERCEIPPANLFNAGQTRQSPYLYSSAQIASLMAAARRLSPPLRGATFETLIGLLAATGMRVGEALRLGRHDVDFESNRLDLLNSKFGKSRQIPVHPSTTEALARYAGLRDETFGYPGPPSFLVSSRGTALRTQSTDAIFRQLREQCSIDAAQGCRPPRPYDLRHSFAVATLLAWHAEGADVQRRLPALSAYLGHLRPANTYWYLEAAPELMAVVATRLERSWEVSG
jgi:integrase/recombinase XerD